MNTIRITVAGATGKMGKAIIEAVLNQSNFVLASAFDVVNSPGLGMDASQFMGQTCGVVITDDIQTALQNTDVLIDFTRPEGSMNHLAYCVKNKVKMVIGTTGFTPSQRQEIQTCSEHIAILQSPNMSVGVNATYQLLALASKLLKGQYDIEIIEAHHRHKVDAPSGTALRMGEVIAQAKGWDFETAKILSREGHTGAREDNKIGFATVRGGEIVGDHTVIFAGQGERIEIGHYSSSRASYANGSLMAAEFLMRHSHGLFDMQDIIQL